MPGEGIIPLHRLLHSLADGGYSGWWELEVISDGTDDRGIDPRYVPRHVQLTTSGGPEAIAYFATVQPDQPDAALGQLPGVSKPACASRSDNLVVVWFARAGRRRHCPAGLASRGSRRVRTDEWKMGCYE